MNDHETNPDTSAESAMNVVEVEVSAVAEPTEPKAETTLKKASGKATGKPKSAGTSKASAPKKSTAKTEATPVSEVNFDQPKAKKETRTMTEAPESKDKSAIDTFFEHQQKAFSETTQAIVSMIPDGVREHGEAAIREAVEGYRVLVNSAIDNVMKALEGAKVEITETIEDAKERLNDVKNGDK